jgi:thymidylate kinase
MCEGLNLKKNSLICFIGIDGSGKTTIAKEINKKFINNDMNSIYVYGRIVPVFSRFLMWLGRIFILKRGKNAIFNDYENYSNQKKQIFEKSIYSKMYERILLLDHLIQIYIKIKIPLLLGKIVVCDRYIFDTIITDISINLGYSLEESVDLIKSTFRYIPYPDFIFYIKVTEELAYSRKDDVPHINYLIERKKLYDNLEKHFKIINLDGSKGIVEITNEAFNLITGGNTLE